MENGNLEDIVDCIAPYKTLVVEYYNEEFATYEKCQLIERDGNVAKFV